MKHIYSLLAFILVSAVVISYRFIPERYPKDYPLVVTTWDALGYYIYLPSVFIYHDYKDLNWFPEADKKYSMSGGWFYQANRCDNGNYVFSYLAGTAVMQLPFFLIGHLVATRAGYPVDGFSPPYQMAIAFGAIIYFILSLLLLRKILLRYFNDRVTAATLLLLALASNIIQYISVDGAMSHSFIFPLYVLALWFTIKWHESPSPLWASLIGLTIGLVTISRPTEAIMFLIPLFWETQTRELAARKWQLLRKYRGHIVWVAVFAFLAVLPQLIYWKSASGSFIDVPGSRWDFLNPHFRVLFGWENGWFIYTPVAIFFIAGMFFMKKYPFYKSVLIFCLLSIYIVIAHHDWRYGATYSCRALSHIYPVFALPLAAFIERISIRWIRYVLIIPALYLIGVNLFQLRQYNKTILHFRDMNRKYYCSIYLNPHPTPVDMSLLDTNDRIRDERPFRKLMLYRADTSLRISMVERSEKTLLDSLIVKNMPGSIPGDRWLKLEMQMKLNSTDAWGSYINAELRREDSTKRNRIRVINPLTRWGEENDYAFYINVPLYFSGSNFRLFITSPSPLEAEVKKISVQYLYN